MTGKIAILCAAILGLLAVGGVPVASAQDQPTRDIVHIAGDVYRFQNNFHYSVFMVTPDGIIVTDPINADAAAWLKAELKRRFDKPIKYLIYSHDHADHIGGGEVFADTATVIAHEKTKGHIIAEGRPTAVPDITFTDQLTISLGGKSVELIYLGRNHSDNLIVMRFPEERVVFVVDLVTVNRLPYRDLRNAYLEDWILSLKKLAAMDFDILSPGHGVVGMRADVAPNYIYLEDLRGQVLGHLRAGKTLDEIKSLVTMSNYKTLGQYEAWLELNIEGMVRHMKQYRLPN